MAQLFNSAHIRCSLLGACAVIAFEIWIASASAPPDSQANRGESFHRNLLNGHIANPWSGLGRHNTLHCIANVGVCVPGVIQLTDFQYFPLLRF